ncbi:ABC transporter permease [Clostridium folliculivorans]|uniref:Transport permease protein n=1 Tax=Clostridium folliculivorans TaxID=2886038 RepID=A0A9W6DD74_9CLOT|nr:ABC transporter permease [Clostridium folliculivorans]GKU27363.1 transport permease protein [Clostridium folliculivorans]GKU32214.1 transport permease protein [Clostridium folliculivorans]
MNIQRFLSIVKKEFIQIKRDKASFAIAIMMPLMMILLFGYAVVTQLEDISMLVLDQSNTPESRELIKGFENTSYFKVVGKVQNIDTIDDSIDNGTAHSALIIPPDYADKIAKHEKPTVQFIVDGSDPTTARTAFSSGVMAAQSQSSKLITKVTSKTLVTNNTSGIDISTKVLFNPTLRNQNYTIPGLIGLIMQNITIILTAFALVREKERGTIEQLIVSPLKSPEIILGKLVPYIVIGFADFIYALVLGIYWFNVPVAGSIPLLILLGFGFVICALAIGILISTIAKTQLQAMQMAFLALLPSVLLSGFVFPREAMPKVIQYIGNVIPLTYFLNIIRGIVLKGLAINYLVQDVTLLFILGLVLLTLSIVRFRKKLD